MYVCVSAALMDTCRISFDAHLSDKNYGSIFDGMYVCMCLSGSDGYITCSLSLDAHLSD